jgi:hypothetical protein
MKEHLYEVGFRKDKRGVDLISDALPKKPCGSGGVRVGTQFSSRKS